MSDKKSFQYVKRMLLLFCAVVTFCSTNKTIYIFISGSKLLSREEDKIIFEGDKDKLTELSRKLGSEVISARLNFLHNEHSS